MGTGVGAAAVASADVAAIAFHQPAADPQAQAGAVGPARHKGLEKPRQQFIRQARAGVGDFNLHRVSARIPRAQKQRAASRHGVNGVDHQVHQHLLQFLPVDGRRTRGTVVTLNADAAAGDLVAGQHQAVVQRTRRVHGFNITCKFCGSCKLQQLRDDESHALDLLVDEPQFGCDALGRGRVQQLAHQVQVALDHRNRVVDLVRDAGRELAHRGELFAFHQLLLRGFKRLRAFCHLGVQAARVFRNHAQQLVQVAGQAADLIKACDSAHARVQRPAFHALHGGGHLLQRAKDAARPAQRNHSGDDHHGKEDRAHAGQRAVFQLREGPLQDADIEHADAPPAAVGQGLVA